MHARIALALMLAWALSSGSAQAGAMGAPVVRRVDAGPDAVQGPVWSVLRGGDGTLWLGSNVLACRELGRWETMDLPDAYAFRALAAGGDGRIWFGAVGALGWLERDDAGRWRAHSLVSELQQAGAGPAGDLWQVKPLGAGAVFSGSDHVLHWDGEHFRRWPLPGGSRPVLMGDANGIAIYQAGVGLLRLRDGGSPEMMRDESSLPERPLTWHVLLPDGSALAGLGDSAYRVSSADAAGAANAAWTRLPALSALLAGALPAAATLTSDGQVAVATLKRGVVYAGPGGEPVAVADETRGLDDNVYALGPDAAGRLLAGCGSGAAWIESPRRVVALDLGASAVQGDPLRVLALGSGLGLLTSRSLYGITGNRFDRRLEPQATLWDAAAGAGSVWIGGFGGIWRLTDGLVVHEHHVSADVTQLTTTAGFPGALLFLENYALRALEPGPYGWVPRDLGPRVADTPISLLEDARGEVWVSTQAGGIQRFSWVRREGIHPVLRTEAHFRPGAGLPARAMRLRLARVGDQLYALGADATLRLNAAGTAFAPAPEFAGFVVLATVADPGSPETAWWLVRAARLGPLAPRAVLRLDASRAGEPVRWRAVAVPGLDTLGAVTLFDRTGGGAEAGLWVGSRGRVLRVALAATTAPLDVSALTLRRMAVDAAVVPGRAMGTPLAAGSRRVELQVAPVPPVDDDALWYESRLDDQPDWSAATPSATREFAGLGAGRHVLRLRAVDRFGRFGPELASEFVIAAPWYLHPAALAGLLLAMAGAAAGLVRWRLRRLERQNVRLGQIVADRTRELELANTAKGEFLENISHELRNPLNGLNGLLALLREDRLGDRERELARSLRACAEHLTRVFEEVLGYAKLEYGAVALRPVVFSARTLLQGLADLWAVQSAAAGGSIRVVLPEDFADGFAADADKIKTIVGNFVSNAVKYAPGTAVELSVEAIAGAGDRVDLHFEVTDHGPGIAAEEQELIFQKFVRGTNAREAAVAGAGLGLATCRVLARALNGDLGVESEAGAGATFYLRVPAKRAAGPMSPALAAPVSPPERHVDPPPAPAARARALIVDDEEYNRTVMQGIALSLGYATEIAASGAEALARVGAVRFDVIFLDWELPDASGGEVAARIRAGANGRPWIVAITAHDSDEMPARCRAAGMDGFLLKPCRPEQVARLLDELAGRPAGADAHREPPPDDGEKLGLQAFEFYARAAPAQAAEAVQLYLTAVDRELAEIDRAAQAGDMAAVATAAHRLRTLGGIIGAVDFAHGAARLEREARARATTGVAAARQDLGAAWAGLRERVLRLPPLTSGRA